MRVVLVLGKAQQGKTTLAWRLLESTSDRLLVLDPVRSKPLTEAITQQAARGFATWPELARFLASESANRGRWRAILRSQNDEDYARALRAAPYYCHTTLLVDEALWFVGSDMCRALLVKCARANAHFGGGIGVPLWLTAQRPMDIPPDIRSQATQVVSFRQDEPRDLAFLSERFSPSFSEEVAALGDHRWKADPPLRGEYERQVDNGNRGGDHRRGDSTGGVPDGSADQRARQAASVDEVTDATSTESEEQNNGTQV